MALSEQVELYWLELMTAKELAICLPTWGGGLGRQICQFVKSVIVIVKPLP